MIALTSLRSTVAALLVLAVAARVASQTEQDTRPMCGRQSADRLPLGVRVTSDQPKGISYIQIDASGRSKTITLGAVDEVSAVCSLPEGRLLAFGSLTSAPGVGYELAVADRQSGMLLDSWDAYTPAISPDEHWIVQRKFYPPHSELPVSEEYLLVPLPGARIHPRPPEAPLEPPVNAIVIYPLGQTNAFMSNIGVPADQAHIFRSRWFFWSDDSRAVLFADSVQSSLSAVLVQASDGGFETLVHPLSATDICEGTGSVDLSGAVLAEGKVSEQRSDASRDVEMKFDPGTSTCRVKDVLLNSSDFQRPKPESHPIRRRKPSTRK